MKTKLTVLSLCLALALPLPAKAQTKMVSFWEGICIGLVLGVCADVVIVVAVNCSHAQRPPPIPPPSWVNTNPPPVLPRYPSTNAPPANTNAVLYSSGSAMDGAWYSSPVAEWDRVVSFQLLSSPDGVTWSHAATLTTWQNAAGLATVATRPDGVALSTNYAARGTGTDWISLCLPNQTNSKTYYRLCLP